MVLPYPERFKWKHAAIYAVVMLTVQLAEGTNVYFATLLTVFIFLFVGAFNAAGGLFYSSGAFIFFTGTLVVLVGCTYKLVTGEPGNSHLGSPVTTMLVYCGGMAGMWLAAYLTRKLAPKRGYTANIATGEAMLYSAAGCLAIGVFFSFAFGSEYGTSGTLGSAIRQVNHFPQLAILLATVYEVRKSEGKSGFNWVSISGILFIFAGGVIYASKEGMFTGPVTWLLGAWASGFNFRTKQLVLGSIFVWFMLYYMVPYSSYVRQFRDETGRTSANATVAEEYIFKLGEVRKLNEDLADEEQYQEQPHFYNHDQGLVGRLSMVAYDDRLVELTDDGSVFGLYPIYHAYLNVVPHVFWPDKPVFFTANQYGHEVGVIGDDDLTTGISFSPVADVYHEAKWFGVFLIYPVIVFMLFMVMDSLTGSLKNSPWPLLPIVLSSHVAPEGLMEGIILQTTYGAFAVFVLAYTVKLVLPLIHKLMTSGNKTTVQRTIDFQLGKDSLVRALPDRVGADSTGS